VCVDSERHVLRAYNAAGGLVGTNTFPANVPADANQSTILMATSQTETRFGLKADGPLSPSGQLIWPSICQVPNHQRPAERAFFLLQEAAVGLVRDARSG
jgi:hypothetical protein